jgi:curved DNA-binding protein
MEFKDHYATLGLTRTATAEDIKRTYRKLARRYHPDVSKAPDAETRFKAVAEAYQALKDPEARAAYDTLGKAPAEGPGWAPPPGWGAGFQFNGRARPSGGGTDGYSDFVSSLFGQGSVDADAADPGAARRGPRARRGRVPQPGGDHHAKIEIDLEDAYRGARRTITLKVPSLDGAGHGALLDRRLDVDVPKGVREGQHLRLLGQGAAGHGGEAAGDLYLQISLRPHPIFRVEGRDVFLDLPVAPWEAALGADVLAPTPEGPVEIRVPPGSAAGRKLRLKGRGIPGTPPGDLYAQLGIALPGVDTPTDRQAYVDLALAFADFAPRSALEAGQSRSATPPQASGGA